MSSLPEPQLLAFEPMIMVLDFGTVVIESMVEITRKGAEASTPLELDWVQNSMLKRAG